LLEELDVIHLFRIVPAGLGEARRSPCHGHGSTRIKGKKGEGDGVNKVGMDDSTAILNSGAIRVPT